MHRYFAALLVIVLCAGIGFADDAPVRTDLTPKDLARVRAVTAPTTDFTKPEQFELLEAGAATSKKIVNRDAFSFPSANLSFDQQEQFSLGNGFFRKVWVSAPSSTKASDGLGPLFNARGCQNCHLKDGRGHPPSGAEDDGVSMFLRISVPAHTDAEKAAIASADESVIPEPTYGTQLQDFGVPGLIAEGRMVIDYTDKPVTLGDGSVVTLRDPRYSVADLAFGPMAPDVMLSPRVTPQMIGLGLVEQIPAADIVMHADPDDKDHDGISGRPNYGKDLVTGRLELGRFGWKAGEPTIRTQAAGAFAGDLGLSTPLNNKSYGDCMPAETECLKMPIGDNAPGESEAPDPILDLVTFYSQNLAVPARRDMDKPEVLRGKQAFYSIGCISCHTPKFVTTRAAEDSTKRFQLIWPYSDFLLHDMGRGLADNRPEGQASGTEWRTAPLWGTGLTETVSDHTFFLHDGRARNLAEAILWHGGEAQASRDAFANLPKSARDDLLSFLGVALMRLLLAATFALVAAQALAASAVPFHDIIAGTIDDFARPKFGALATAAATLHDEMAALCATPSESTLQSAQDGFKTTVLAFSSVEFMRMGPLGVGDRFERLLFWPDTKGIALRQVQAAVATKDATAADATTLKNKSVAMQGLGAVEYLLFGTGFDDLASSGGAYRCAFASAATTLIAGIADVLSAEWADTSPAGASEAMLDPKPDGTDYRSELEVLNKIGATLSVGTDVIRDQRLSPILSLSIGTPKPKAGLFWRSGMTAASIAANFEGLRDFFRAAKFGAAMGKQNAWIATGAEFEFKNAIDAAAEVKGPLDVAVTTSDGMLGLKQMYVSTGSLDTLLGDNLGAVLGLTIGFSQLDGD